MILINKRCTETNFYESAPALNSNNESVNINSCNQQSRYNIEFVFDCDCDVQIRIHYFANEKFAEATSGQQKSNSKSDPNGKFLLNYACNCTRFNTNFVSNSNINETHTIQAKCICLNSDTHPVVYKKGSNILFKHPKHFIVPSKFPNSAVNFINLIRLFIFDNFYVLKIEVAVQHSRQLLSNCY
jgi:hypothetical protein